jgi:hypothetical protein
MSTFAGESKSAVLGHQTGVSRTLNAGEARGFSRRTMSVDKPAPAAKRKALATNLVCVLTTSKQPTLKHVAASVNLILAIQNRNRYTKASRTIDMSSN